MKGLSEKKAGEPGRTDSLAGLVDCHTHTHFSHDSACDPNDSLAVARKKGLFGIAVTDHGDMEYVRDRDIPTMIHRSAEEARHLGEGVLVGVELGEAIWNRHETAALLKQETFDIVLGSVHAVRYQSHTVPYSKIDFSAFSADRLDGYLTAYFRDVREMAETADFDVLSHLTCPLRYISGRYGREVDLRPYGMAIEDILKEIIQREIALEVNTSCLGTEYPVLLPEASVLSRYRELGGRLLTLGSDAHTADRVGFGFEETLFLLADLGFRKICYYRKRQPVWQAIPG